MQNRLASHVLDAVPYTSEILESAQVARDRSLAAARAKSEKILERRSVSRPRSRPMSVDRNPRPEKPEARELPEFPRVVEYLPEPVRPGERAFVPIMNRTPEDHEFYYSLGRRAARRLEEQASENG